MKTTTINLSVYEVGDVLTISKDVTNLESKKRLIGDSKRALVVGALQRADGLFSYRVVCDNYTSITLRASEQQGIEYVGHIDMGLLLGGE